MKATGKSLAGSTPQAVKFFNLAGNLMCDLYCRWQDEKQYEDIKDYAEPIAKLAKKVRGVKIGKMFKRPFGCEFTVAGKTFRLKVTARAYEYKRVG